MLPVCRPVVMGLWSFRIRFPCHARLFELMHVSFPPGPLAAAAQLDAFFKPLLASLLATFLKSLFVPLLHALLDVPPDDRACTCS